MTSGILRLSVSGLLAIITLTSCSSNLPLSSVENNSNKINSSTGVNQNVGSTLVTGKIDYQSGLKIKATLADIATKSTVSLIDPVSNVTIVTGLSDVSGNFSINPSTSFFPTTGQIFRLEASRRLGTAGNDLMSLRTLLQWTGSTWQSITTQGIYINYKTTALALASSYESATITPASVINQIDTSTGASSLAASNVLYNISNNAIGIYSKPVGGNKVPVALGGMSVMPNSNLTKIVYSKSTGPSNDIFTANPDGTGELPLTNTSTRSEIKPVFSPDGLKVAYRDSLTGQVYVVNSDGMNNRIVDGTISASNTMISWSGDNQTIVYENNGDIYTANAALPAPAIFTNPVNLTLTLTTDSFNPVFLNPFIILYENNSDLYYMTADATGSSKTLYVSAAKLPSVSKDGSKIAFVKSNLVKTDNFIVSTFAGGGATGTQSGTANNGNGTSALFSGSYGVAFDSSGNAYVADRGNARIRKILPNGDVTTFAGTNSEFNDPSGIAVDSANNVYVGDQTRHKISKITPAGVVSTLAGSGVAGSANGTGTNATFNGPTGVAVDSDNNVYVGDYTNNMVRKITPLGVVTTLASGFNRPFGVAVDSAKNVYVADSSNNKIRKIDTAGLVSTLAGGGATGTQSGTSDGTGTIVGFNFPVGITVDSAGTVYVADTSNNKIRKINSAGVVSTIAGDGTAGNTDGYGTTARFNTPYGVAVGKDNNVYVGDYANNTVRKIVPELVESTSEPANNIYTLGTSGGPVKQLTSFASTAKITNSPTWNGDNILFVEDSFFKDILSINSKVTSPVSIVAAGSNLVNITNNGTTDVETGKPYATKSTVNTPPNLTKFNSIINLVAHCITNNVDPVDYIAYSGGTNGTYSIVNPAGLDKVVFDNIPVNVDLIGTELTYVFRNVPGKSYQVRMNTINTTDAYLKVFSPGNTTNTPDLFNNDENANTKNSLVTIPSTATAGTYRIVLTTADTNGNAATNPIGKFILSVTQAP